MTIDELLPGDLLFVRDSSEFSTAIIHSTSQYSHVGIYFDRLIYHATRKLGVVRQDLLMYMKEGGREVFVYRYRDIDVDVARQRAEFYIGRAYNDAFSTDDSTLYCSQYIARILPIFDTVPMQFGDENNLVSEFWQQYFDELGVSVPVNLEGTNPSQLSQSDKLHFIGQLEV